MFSLFENTKTASVDEVYQFKVYTIFAEFKKTF